MDMLNRGCNPEEIAAERGISLDAVYNHLITLYNNEEAIRHHSYMKIEEIESVRTAYKKAGEPDTLSEIAAFLRDPLPFYKIKLALVLMNN
ncbi:MAG TPA: helix-turn-helix domain-containing protein [Saprospiraceae bacterium]|nr:helix-turn-helix domain-containing protein [Saprospiraceae bacterium]